MSITKNKSKILVSLLIILCLVFTAFTFSACNNKDKKYYNLMLGEEFNSLLVSLDADFINTVTFDYKSEYDTSEMIEVDTNVSCEGIEFYKTIDSNNVDFYVL